MILPQAAGADDAEMPAGVGAGAWAGGGSAPNPPGALILDSSNFKNGVRTDTPHPLKRGTPNEGERDAAADI